MKHIDRLKLKAERLANPRCDFCGKGHKEVKRLIAGPTVYICNECTGLASDICGTHEAEHRAAMVRAVLGQQWATMMTARIICDEDVDEDGALPSAASRDDDLAIVADLWPPADDVVADILGGVRP